MLGVIKCPPIFLVKLIGYYNNNKLHLAGIESRIPTTIKILIPHPLIRGDKKVTAIKFIFCILLY